MGMLADCVESFKSVFTDSTRKNTLSMINEIAVDVAAIRKANEIRVSKVEQYKKEEYRALIN